VYKGVADAWNLPLVSVDSVLEPALA